MNQYRILTVFSLLTGLLVTSVTLAGPLGDDSVAYAACRDPHTVVDVWKDHLAPPLSFENLDQCVKVCGKWVKTCEQSVGHGKGCLSNVNKAAAAQAREDCLAIEDFATETACKVAAKDWTDSIGEQINAEVGEAKQACRDYRADCIDQCETPAIITYAIGDTGPGGGTVFYLNEDGSGGLEAAPEDQSERAEWGCIGTEITGADGTAIGTGAQNTAAILADCGEAGIAAKLADAYTSPNGSDDWYLPSRDELNKLYEQKDVVGGFANAVYWSSSEDGSNLAWAQDFGTGFQGVGSKNNPFRVRAVRAFTH